MSIQINSIRRNTERLYAEGKVVDTLHVSTTVEFEAELRGGVLMQGTVTFPIPYPLGFDTARRELDAMLNGVVNNG